MKLKNKHWYVFFYNFNKGCIETYDVLQHGRLIEDLKKLARKKLDKATFKEELRKSLMHYFWAKCEYEIIISAWPPNENAKDEKVDIYSQIMLNYDAFCDYILGE